MRRVIVTFLVMIACLSISVSCTKKAEKKEEKKEEAGVVERAIIGPIKKAKEVKERSKERADKMEKEANDVLGETKEEAK
jgi:hypothetical protein